MARKKEDNPFGAGQALPFINQAINSNALSEWAKNNPGLPIPPELMDQIGGQVGVAAAGDPFARMDQMSARRGGKAPPRNTLFGMMGGGMMGGLFGGG